MLGVIGILLGIATLIFLTWKGWHMGLATIAAAFVVILFNGMDIWPAISESAFKDFAGSWFLLFALGAIFGKGMDESGAAATISNFIVSKLGKKRIVLVVLVTTAILAYGGISVFVIMFTMYPICMALFKDADIPRKLFPAMSICMAGTTCMTFLPGAPSVPNLVPTEALGTTIYAAPVIGILGGTGSSKSTLVQLIPRLYDVTEGCVKVGGIDVRKYDLEVLRNNVAVVLQKNVLFSGTIKDNLRWGNEHATDEEMIHACKLAQADGFIQSFPDGYDTYIEQGGTNVSGGQKQRLCIARALLKNPKVLILDDSTSAVDTATDALIRHAFREEIPNVTKIIIAQRVASVMDADQIVVLDEGRLMDVGTHDELMSRSAIYREVYESQMKGGDEK